MAGATAHYGSSQALYGVDLTVRCGETVALMGRNGVGKSTTLRCICQLTPHAEGSIRFNGTDLSGMEAYQVARLGIALAPEGRRCFATLTVLENLTAAARPGQWDLASVFDLFPQLGERRSQLARTLSGGEQQMLAIARALLTNPKLLLLDEATEGLAPLVRKEIWDAVSGLKDSSGLAILLVDKSLKEISKAADRCVVLARGRDVWSGRPAELTDDVIERHLGL